MSAIDQSISKRLLFAIILTAITLVAEIAGGLWSNSLALLSDAGHVFLDLFALLLSLGAIKLAAQPANEKHSYGWHRAEVLAALFNGLTVLVMALAILYEGSKRLISPEEVKTVPMLVIAILGLITNLLAAKGLHGHAHDDLNVRSAFLHVLGDAAASVGVIAGALLIYYTGWYQADPIISIAIGLLILIGAGRVLRDALHILMEGAPRGLTVGMVADHLRSIDGVVDLHHVNLWSICSHITAFSAHMEITPESDAHRAELLHHIEDELAEHFKITHTTIQLVCTGCSGGPLLKELSHQQHEHSDDCCRD